MSIKETRTKAGQPRWEVRWREGGRQRARWFDNVGEAAEFNQLKLGESQQERAAAAEGNKTVGRWGYEVLYRLRDELAPKTLQRYKDELEFAIIPALGSKPLNRVTLRDLDKVVQARKRRLPHPDSKVGGTIGGLAAANKTATLLRTMFREAQLAGLIQRNVAKDLTTPQPNKKTHSEDTRIPSVAQIRGLIADLVERDLPWHAALVAVMAYTGARPSEAISLRWEHVHRGAGARGEIQYGIDVVTENRGQVRQVKRTGKGKSSAARRRIPIIAALTEWMDWLQAHRNDDYPWVFWTAEPHDDWPDSPFGGTWPMRQALTCDRVSSVARRLGFAFTAYDCRHFYASALIHHGASQVKIKRRMGHRSITTTLDNYGHLWRDDVDRDADIDLDSVFDDGR